VHSRNVITSSNMRSTPYLSASSLIPRKPGRRPQVGRDIHLGGIVRPVIPAVHLDDDVFPGERPCGPHDMKGCFRAGVAVADLVHARDAFAQETCVFGLDDGGGTEHGAFAQLLACRGDDSRMGVAVYQRGEVVDEVDVFVPVAVVQAAAFSLYHVGGIRHVVRDRPRIATRKMFLGLSVVLLRLPGPFPVPVYDRFHHFVTVCGCHS